MWATLAQLYMQPGLTCSPPHGSVKDMFAFNSKPSTGHICTDSTALEAAMCTNLLLHLARTAHPIRALKTGKL